MMPGVVHGHNEETNVYVGLKNGSPLILGELCAFFQYRTTQMLQPVLMITYQRLHITYSKFSWIVGTINLSLVIKCYSRANEMNSHCNVQCDQIFQDPQIFFSHPTLDDISMYENDHVRNWYVR